MGAYIKGNVCATRETKRRTRRGIVESLFFVDNGEMDCKPLTVVAAGFPEMWQPVYDKYRLFFELAIKLQPIVNEMTQRPMSGQLSQIVCRMVLAAANTNGALLTLVLNGYGHDAMKLARSIYETELNIVWLKKHPEDIRDFVDYLIIRHKLTYDQMDKEQQQQLPMESYERMMTKYAEVLPRFAIPRDKTRPRNEWCRVSISEKAKEAGLLELHRTFYRWASSMHHGDIGGLSSQADSEGKADVAPSWSWLELALVSGLGSFVRCLGHFDEIAQLGFKERLENGPNQDYAVAVKGLPPPTLGKPEVPQRET